jgi:hypothetical protein
MLRPVIDTLKIAGLVISIAVVLRIFVGDVASLEFIPTKPPMQPAPPIADSSP